MVQPERLQFFTFGKDDPLTSISNSNESTQADYLLCYLDDLGASTVIEEPNYFDRDYLAEFAAFYSVSSRGYANICRRLHFFSNEINRTQLRSAAGGSDRQNKILQDSYLGFIIIRPIPAAPLGRTVLTWYPEQEENKHTPRMRNPSRDYKVHVAGIELTVNGLAWQQQDTGVGACATVSLWSMLHSSAFDDHHAIPTTADITRDAHSKHSFGSRVFPSQGLNFYQICDAIKEQKLAPLITEGDIKSEKSGKVLGFSRERFLSTCAAYIRSGYPILLSGNLMATGSSGHAICVVGFRSCVPSTTDPNSPSLAESGIEYIYIHDDNLGPNVRFKVDTVSLEKEVAVLSADAPEPVNKSRTLACPTKNYPEFIPTQIIVAAHNDIRTDPDKLHRAGLRNATYISKILNLIADKNSQPRFGLTVSTRFIKLATYLGDELSDRLGDNPKVLSSVRLALCEKVDPMSLHIGVVRIGLDDSTPLVDIIYDTTDSDRNHPIFCYVAYSDKIPDVMDIIESIHSIGLGPYKTSVKAY